MIVCLVLEADEPVLRLSVDLHRNNDGAGVDLVGNIQILQLALGAEPLHAHQSDIHKAGELVAAAGIDLSRICLVHFKSFLNGFCINPVIKSNLL